MSFKIANLKSPNLVITYYPGNEQGDQLQLDNASLNSGDQKWDMLPYATDGSYHGVVIYNAARGVALCFNSNNRGLKVLSFSPKAGDQVLRVDPNILWDMMWENNALRFARPGDNNTSTIEAAGDNPGKGAKVETWNWNHGINQLWVLYPA